jgi:tetratricopeptide (TPR) repeat protein/glyoxylase-like metal-dependent hydrolase (beta-lactamase superfamily II)
MQTTRWAILLGVAAALVFLGVDCRTASAKTPMEQGEEACKKKDYDLAIKFFTEAIRLNAKDGNAYHCRGTAYSNKEDNDRAIADFTEAIRLDPGSAQSYFSRASIYHNKGDHEKAIADCTEVIRLEPKNAMAFFIRGSNFAKGKHGCDSAIKDFTEAIRVDPHNESLYAFYWLRAESYVKKGELDKGIADYTESIRLDPKRADTYCSRGRVYYERQAYDKAIADLSEAVRLKPDHAAAYLFRASAYTKKKDYDKAIADFDTVVRLQPKEAKSYYMRGLLHTVRSEFDKATADFNEVLRLSPNNVEVQKQLVRLQEIKVLSGKLDAAKELEKAKQRIASMPEQKKTQVPGFYRMMLGNVEITALFDGMVELDSGLLQNISEADIAALLKRAMIDDPHKIAAPANAYLVNTGIKLVLIDAGGGAAYGKGLGRLIENLKASGYKPEEVDTVLITHLHPDHVGGLVDLDGKSAFAKAVVYVAKAENDYWLSDVEPKVPAAFKEHLKKARKMVRDTAKPYLDSKRWRTFDEGKLPILGIKAVAIPGHTPGHTAYEIQSGGQKLVVIGDMVHVAAVQFARPDAAVSFDSDPKKAVATREALFRQLADNRAIVADMHVAFPGLGRIRSDGKDVYTWVPIEWAPLPAAEEPRK